MVRKHRAVALTVEDWFHFTCFFTLTAVFSSKTLESFSSDLADFLAGGATSQGPGPFFPAASLGCRSHSASFLIFVLFSNLFSSWRFSCSFRILKDLPEFSRFSVNHGTGRCILCVCGSRWASCYSAIFFRTWCHVLITMLLMVLADQNYFCVGGRHSGLLQQRRNWQLRSHLNHPSHTSRSTSPSVLCGWCFCLIPAFDNLCVLSRHWIPGSRIGR